MKTLSNIVLGIGMLGATIGIAELIGVGKGVDSHNPDYQVISGKVKGVGESCEEYGYLSYLIKENGQDVLCSIHYSHASDLSRGEAILEAELDGGELVKSYGYFEVDIFGNKIFRVSSLKTRGCRIDFRKIGGNPFETPEKEEELK